MVEGKRRGGGRWALTLAAVAMGAQLVACGDAVEVNRTRHRASAPMRTAVPVVPGGTPDGRNIPGASVGAGRTPTPGRRAPTTPQVAPHATCVPLVSVGLGLTRAEWERRVGAPVAGRVETGDTYGGYTEATYDARKGRRYEVTFQDDRVVSIGYRLGRGEALSLREARALVRPLLPNDLDEVRKAAVVRWPGRGKVRDEVYLSRSLLEAASDRYGYGGPCVLPGMEKVRGMPIAVTYELDARGRVRGLMGIAQFTGP